MRKVKFICLYVYLRMFMAGKTQGIKEKRLSISILTALKYNNKKKPEFLGTFND